jgi:hypothetical protein
VGLRLLGYDRQDYAHLGCEMEQQQLWCQHFQRLQGFQSLQMFQMFQMFLGLQKYRFQ